jgi:hypothetical protein
MATDSKSQCADGGRRAGMMLLVVVLLGWGCQPKPKAPALIDDPVFQTNEGFRFLVPEGWIMAARGNVPPGPIEKERLLVQYHRVQGDSQATLEVSLMDLPEDTDLTAYLSGPSYSVSRWELKGKPESIEGGGRTGTRFRVSGSTKSTEMAKEVTVFRRGGRVYFFTLLYAPKDPTAPEQVRRAIGRLEWTK